MLVQAAITHVIVNKEAVSLVGTVADKSEEVGRMQHAKHVHLLSMNKMKTESHIYSHFPHKNLRKKKTLQKFKLSDRTKFKTKLKISQFSKPQLETRGLLVCCCGRVA